MAYTRLNKARTKQTTRTKDGGQVSRYERYETGLITGNHRSMIAVIADEAGYDGLGFQPDAGTPDDSYHVLNVFNEKGGYIDTMAVGGAMDDEHAVTVASTQLHRFGGDKLKVVSGQAAQYDSLSIGHSESLSVVPATTWSIDAISKLMDNPSQDRGFTPLITGSELDREAVRVTYDDVEWSEPQWDGGEIIGGNQLLSHGGRDSNLYLDMTRADTLNQLVAPFDLRDELAAIGATDEPSYDALIENKGRLHILCDRLFNAMARTAIGDVRVISRTQTKEFKRGGVMNIAFVFELSDGQAISIWFHSPDNTPAKLLPQDVMISWKWMLNKRDVTAILSPKNGDNVALPALASRMLRLAAKNSKRFASTQARAIKAAEELEQAQADYDAKQATIVQLDADIADLTAKIDVAMTAPKLTVNDGTKDSDTSISDDTDLYSDDVKSLSDDKLQALYLLIDKKATADDISAKRMNALQNEGGEGFDFGGAAAEKSSARRAAVKKEIDRRANDQIFTTKLLVDILRIYHEKVLFVSKKYVFNEVPMQLGVSPYVAAQKLREAKSNSEAKELINKEVAAQMQEYAVSSNSDAAKSLAALIAVISSNTSSGEGLLATAKNIISGDLLLIDAVPQEKRKYFEADQATILPANDLPAPKLTTPVSDASDADIATVNDGSVSADAGYTDEPNKYSLSPKDLKEFQKGLAHAPQDVKSDILAEIDKLKQSLDAKSVSYLGEHKYQDAINSGEQVGMSLSGQIKRLKEHEQQVVALRDKKIRPSEIVGSGYSNPRIAAFQSLGMSITRLRLSINGNPSGFNETVNLSNYRGYLQSALKNADKTMAQNSGDASQPENFLPFSYDEDFGDYTSYYDGTKKDSVSVRYNENKDGWDLYTDDELSRGFNTQDDPKFIKTTADLVARYPSFTGIDAAHELNKSRKNTKENTMRAISAFSKTHANFEGFIASNNDAEKALYGKKKGSWVAHITSDNNVTVFMALDDASAYTGATNSDVESAYNDIFSNSKAAAARLGTDYDLADIENKETPVVTGLGGQDTPTPTPITPENVAVGDRVVWRGVADLHGIFRGFTNDGAQAVIVINGSQMTAPTSEVYLDNTPLDNNPNEPKNANEKTTNKRVIEGKSNNAKTPKGTKITSNFALVDAKFLIASHTASGSKNPKYPQDLQPRDRARESSIAWVQKTSKSLDPESLGRTSRVDTGAPIAGDDLIVESGNGRTIAIKMAYRDGNAGEYREWLIENADMFGFTPNQVESFKQPILVRIRKTEVNRAEFAVEANQDDKLSFTASERAKSDAKRITNGMLDLFNPSESGDLLSASNYDFVKTFLGSLGDTEAAQYTDSNGQPTQALAARMKAAVFSKAYNDDRLLEMMADQTNPDLQNMINALSLAAGKFVEAQASNRSQAIDITDGLVNAVEQSLNDKVKSAIIEASNILSNAKRNNQGVAEYVTQLGLFEEISPATAELAVFLANNSRSAKKMAEYFKAMAGFVDNNAKQNQTLDIFGDPEPVSLSDVINHANKVTGTNDLFSEENMPAPAGTTEPNTQNDAIAQRVNDLETAVGAADFDPSSLNADDLTSLVDDVQAYPELAARVSGIIKTYQEKAVAVAMSVLSSLNGGA